MSRKRGRGGTGERRRNGKTSGPTRRKSAGRAGGKSRSHPDRSRTRRRPLRRLVRWAFTAAIWAALLFAALFLWFGYDLPDIDHLAAGKRTPSVTVLAADGSTIATYGDRYGATVRLSDLPPSLPHAVLAAEDRRFYEHFGIDPVGILRALWTDLRAGGIVAGGSTLTQQLAKNLFLSPDRTIGRKIREAILAMRLEDRFTKDQILEIYLNRVYLGAGTWGVDAAARRYFGRPAARLNLYQSALIAGLLKAPSRYNPVGNPKLADMRARIVLGAMADAGYITKAQAAQARQHKGAAPRRTAGTGRRYFADWVLDRAGSYVGASSSDLVVRTTFDPKLQVAAERRIGHALSGPAKTVDASQAALVAMTPRGAVRAMVGGRDYGTSQFNRATQALRQPGSAFKPVVYLAALEAGLRPDSTFRDAPVRIGNWTPHNYGNRYYGEVTLREALTRSLNSVAVRVAERVGLSEVIAAARRLGITSKLESHPSIALGASEVSLIELTGAYAVFANGGLGVWPYGVTEIRDREGHLLYRRKGSGPGRVVAETHVEALNDLLRAVIEWGTGRHARLDRPAAGKTGTSQDFRDAWFIGYTPDLVAGVWMGNDDGSPMKGVTGGGLPAEIWRGFMTDALEGTPPRTLPGVIRQGRDQAESGR